MPLFRFVLLLAVLCFVAPVSAQQKPPEPDGENGFPYNWNEAHNRRDSLALSALFHETVKYYGVRMSREKVVAAKMKFLHKNAQYRQEVLGPIQWETEDRNGTVQFIKRTINGDRVQTLGASLKIMYTGGSWKITEESDSVTDARANTVSAEPETDTLAGSFSGKGMKEKVWLQLPKIKEDEMECVGECNAILHCSRPGVEPLVVKNCIGSNMTNLGDLDGNGTDEIGILHEWFTSCWKAYDVYTFRNNRWQLLIPPISTHCNLWEQEGRIVRKHPTRKGYVIIRYSAFTDDIVTKEKTVKLR